MSGAKKGDSDPHGFELRCKLSLRLISYLAEIRRLRAWTTPRGNTRAAGTTVVPALILRMAILVTNWIATSGVHGDLAARGVSGIFV